jgi:hypothetical protein
VSQLRIVLGIGGFLLALLSVVWDNRMMAWGAIALLTASLAMRLILRRRETNRDSDDDGSV